MNNYLRNPRFYHQSEQDSESALVSRNTNETGKRLGGMDEHPIILDFEKEKKLSTDMSILHKSLLPTKESHEKRKELADNVKKVLNDEFPNKEIEVHMFGSSMNELGTTQSDVDLCVTTQWNGLKNIHVLSDCLKKHMKVEQIVSKAKVPIVRLFDQNLDLACDINVNNTLALHNTRLIRKYVSIDPRVQPLAMIVKHWARKRVLNDAAKGGTISTYTWTCIILNFLQMRDPPILPILHQIPHKDIDPIMVNGEDASFYEDVDTLSQFGSKNKETIGGLLFAFFRRMAFEFNYDEHVISLRQGKYLTKAEKGWDTCKGWKMLCVEEPFNTARNLGNSADDVSVNGLIAEFKRAYEILYESACLEKLCEQYQFPLNHYINNNYYPPSRYRQLSKRNNKNNPMWKPNRRNYYPRYHQQNGQNNCLSNTTDNLHDMNGKSNDLQDGEEDGSSMRRFDSVSHTSHYNGSEESTPVSVYYHYENNDSLTRKQFDNLQYQSKRYNNHHNVSKDDEQLRSQSKQKNSFYSKKRNDDQSHNYGQSQDSEHEGDSDQKSFVHDSEKRPYYKSHSNKNVHNSKQVEEPIIDDLSSNSNFDRSNPISSPKSNNKSNNKNRFNKHTQPQRQYQKPTGNVDFNNNNYSCNNDKVDDSFSSNSIPPSNSGSTNLTASYSMYHQLYNRQSGDGSTQYQRRMSHQSSKHLNNNNTNGYNNSVNGNFRTNNTTNNSSMTMALSYNDSNLQDVPFIPSYINQGQGGQHGNDYNLNCDINGYKGSNGSFKSNNNNSNSSNSWKSSNGHYYNKTTNGNSNTNSGMKLANGGNNPPNRSPITGSNYKPFDGSNNNPNSQIKNFNKNGGGNNKKRTNKNRTGVKAENKEDGVSYQLQYSQEGSVQERQNKKVGQNGQSNNSGKGKGHKKHPSCPKQNVAFQQQ
ncbi:6847_t:CDS:10 [Rhizophagus irregularis]|nr:6847_t:CDS:10 [Rhizophagus irregularis]